MSTRHPWLRYRVGHCARYCYISCKLYVMTGVIRGLVDCNDTLLFLVAATGRAKAYFPVSLTALCSLIYLF